MTCILWRILTEINTDQKMNHFKTSSTGCPRYMQYVDMDFNNFPLGLGLNWISGTQMFGKTSSQSSFSDCNHFLSDQSEPFILLSVLYTRALIYPIWLKICNKMRKVHKNEPKHFIVGV